MPLGGQDLSKAAAALQVIYEPEFAVTLNQRYTTYRLLQNRGRVKTITKERIQWLVKNQRHGNAQSIPDAGTLPNPGYSTRVPATLDFKIIIAMISVGRLFNMGSTSDQYFKTAGIVDALADQTVDAIDDVANQINTQLTVNTKAAVNDMDSFSDALCSTTNTYANIGRVANAYWRPYVNAAAGVNRALTEAFIQDMFTNIVSVRGGTIAEVWCGTAAWQAAETLFRTIAPARNNDPNAMYAGASVLYYRGKPFVLNPDIDTNRMLFLDFVNGGIDLVKQHPEDIMIRVENTDSYDERLSAAVHMNLKVIDPWHQGCLDDVE